MNSAEANTAVLLDVSRNLIQRIDALWEAKIRLNTSRVWRTARTPTQSYSNGLLLDRSRNPTSSTAFGLVPGVYTSWKAPHLRDPQRDVKRFVKTRQKAEANVAQRVTLGQTRLSFPDVILYIRRWGPKNGECTSLTASLLLLLSGVQ